MAQGHPAGQGPHGTMAPVQCYPGTAAKPQRNTRKAGGCLHPVSPWVAPTMGCHRLEEESTKIRSVVGRGAWHGGYPHFSPSRPLSIHTRMLRAVRAPPRGLRTPTAMAGGDDRTCAPCRLRLLRPRHPTAQHHRSTTAALIKWHQGLILNERWMKVSSVLHQAEISARKKPGKFRKPGFGSFPLLWELKASRGATAPTLRFPGPQGTSECPGRDIWQL